jgi:hypothetical protein
LGFNGSALAWTLETQFKQGKKAQTLAGYSPDILGRTTILVMLRSIPTDAGIRCRSVEFFLLVDHPLGRSFFLGMRKIHLSDPF